MHQPARLLPSQHVQHQHIVVAVAVEVGEVDAHRGTARVADGQPGHRAKPAAPVVDPEPVGVGKIVADVQVRREIPVDIAKSHGQTPVTGGRKRPTVLISEIALLKNHLLKFTCTVVQVETVRLRQLPNPAFRCCQKPATEPWLKGGLAIDTRDDPFPSPPTQRVSSACVGDVHHVDVIGHIQVEVAVAVHVTQREAHGRVLPSQPGVCRLGEPAPAVIHKQSRASGDAVDQQVGVAVAVDVGERRPGRKLPGASDAGRPGDIGELPAA